VPGADGTSIGAVSVKVDGAGPRLGDDAKGPPHDRVVDVLVMVCPGALPRMMRF
jgi:hypothetical protein